MANVRRALRQRGERRVVPDRSRRPDGVLCWTVTVSVDSTPDATPAKVREEIERCLLISEKGWRFAATQAELRIGGQ